LLPMPFKSLVVVFCMAVFAPHPWLHGQALDPAKMIAATVELDSVVITAMRSGFNIEDFIHLVEQDSSLYLAFHNLRSASYLFETSMAFDDKDGDVRATYEATHRQTYLDSCRSMATIREGWTGDFFKGRTPKHRYYTYELYDRVFLTHGIKCSNKTGTKARESAMDRHYDGLKTLIFHPGRKAQVPLIGNKTEIFSEKMIGRYDFTITAGDYKETPVYIFTARVKDALEDKENKTVFKELVTFFSRADFQVVARKYSLSQRHAAFQFDVHMDIGLIFEQDRYYPSQITYSGTWDIPLKRQEAGTFTVLFSEFE
jgi:hypothetical protein